MTGCDTGVQALAGPSNACRLRFPGPVRGWSAVTGKLTGKRCLRGGIASLSGAGWFGNRKKGSVTAHGLIDTTEMYLRTVFELEEEGIVPLRARIAERLSQSGPTVS